GTRRSWPSSCRSPDRPPGLAAEVSEGGVASRAGFGGETEDPFGDDGALDLVGAAGDPVAGGAEDVVGPGEVSPLAGVGAEAGAEQVGDDVGHPGHGVRPGQLP